MSEQAVQPTESSDPFWEKILTQVKTFRGQNVPPEKFWDMASQLEACLSFARMELAERTMAFQTQLEQVAQTRDN